VTSIWNFQYVVLGLNQDEPRASHVLGIRSLPPKSPLAFTGILDRLVPNNEHSELRANGNRSL
jgi:hypothetical protein